MKKLFVLIKAPAGVTLEQRDAISTAFQYAISNGGAICVAHDLSVDVYKVDTSEPDEVGQVANQHAIRALHEAYGEAMKRDSLSSDKTMTNEAVSSKISDAPSIGPSVPPPPPPPPNG